MTEHAALFQDLADVYDALVDWPKRLANEEPFYRELFARAQVRSVLDTACGTGRHAALFHSWGCRVEGADVSPAMIARCRQQFGEAESLHWVERAFDQPAAGRGPFDAVLCVGNSLALVADQAAVAQAVRTMLAATRTGGVCVIQVLNLWHLPDGPCVWQKCRPTALGGQVHILVKGVHRAGPRGYVDLIDVTLTPAGATPRFDSQTFLGLEADDLTASAHACGARDVQCYGNFQRAPYDRPLSQDLIVVIDR
jgi:SAM-dependent methyltransferase